MNYTHLPNSAESLPHVGPIEAAPRVYTAEDITDDLMLRLMNDIYREGGNFPREDAADVELGSEEIDAIVDTVDFEGVVRGMQDAFDEAERTGTLLSGGSMNAAGHGASDTEVTPEHQAKSTSAVDRLLAFIIDTTIDTSTDAPQNKDAYDLAA